MLEHGEVGHLGPVVEVTVRCQDTGNVTTQLQQIEDLIVRVKIRKTNIVLKNNVGKVLNAPFTFLCYKFHAFIFSNNHLWRLPHQ